MTSDVAVEQDRVAERLETETPRCLEQLMTFLLHKRSCIRKCCVRLDASNGAAIWASQIALAPHSHLC